MSTINIMGYDVDFPYENPYDLQKVYMEKVMECLHNKLHGVLESPTGTGKTLSLLAPISAWVRTEKIKAAVTPDEPQLSNVLGLSAEELPPEIKEVTKWGNKKRSKVWYTARTHSQIAQTIAEARRCNIRGLNMRVLGARDQLCINPAVLEEKESYVKTLKCKELIKGRHCKYYRKLQQEKDGKYYQTGEVMDIEDLVRVGRTCGVCPYYLSKLQIETSDIVFLPYNYIIDQDSRDSNNLQFHGDVVVFDEGHNVPNTCEESYEFSFTSVDIALGIRNIQELMVGLSRVSDTLEDDEELDIAKHAENAIILMEMLTKLEAGLNTLKVSEELLPVSTLYDFLDRAGIAHSTASRITQIIQDYNSDSAKLNLPGSILSTFHLLEKMANTIFGSTVKSFDRATIDRSFKWSVRMDQDKVNNSKRVSLYCFNPSFGIRALLQVGVQSIIITSGTLSPLRTFIHELHLPKPVTLQNGHIAKQSQIPFLILGTGVNNVRMDASFVNRNDPKYQLSLGMSLTNLIASVPDGVLLLFSSYSMMKSLRETWEGTCGVWNRLNSLKRVFEEPRGKNEFIECMENYRRCIDSGNGAILMGVLRGKISEGMDFKDQYCRAVFIIGVPFPPTMDPRVKGKEKYAESLTFIDRATNKEQKLYNKSYMSVEAMKATNQAIGRVIRHGQDYGAIILVDYRFSRPVLFTNISEWLRGSRSEEKNFPQAKKILTTFFRDVHSGKMGVPEVRYQRVDGNGCPVAGFVSYEVYEHKTATRTPAPWIKADNFQAEDKPREKANFEYVDSGFHDITSLYGGSQSENSSPPETNVKKANSVFDAMQQCRSTCPGYDDPRVAGEASKRKFRCDEDLPLTSKISCLNKPADTVSKEKDRSREKKPTRIKIKPFLKGDGQEPESVVESFLPSQPPQLDTLWANYRTETREKNGDELKINLVNYFKGVKEKLTESEGSEFKKSAYSYMKGERNLLETVTVLERIFSSEDRKKLFSGFSICIRSKDRKEWENVCRAKKIELSS